MKNLMLIILCTLSPLLSRADDLHAVIINKISADHAFELKTGDFANRRGLSRSGETSERLSAAIPGDPHSSGNALAGARSAIANISTLEKHEGLRKDALSTRPRRY